MPRNEIIVKRVFDLKGSEVARETKSLENVPKTRALKDKDYKLLTRISTDLVQFQKEDIIRIEENLINDLEMLSSCNLMDYSLLLIIIDNSLLDDYIIDPFLSNKLFKSDNGKNSYILGIIDFLQNYNFKKKFEHQFLNMMNDDKASAVDSKLYAYRMYCFSKRHLIK